MITKEQVKNYVKDNKWEIARCAFVGLLCGASVCLGWTVCDRAWTKQVTDVMTVTHPINTAFTIADFGKVGEEVVAMYSDINPDTVVEHWRIWTK